MGIFDFFSGKKKEKERQEQLRIQQEQKRHAEERRKIAEQQKFQEQKRQEGKMLSNFDYDSTCHQRYENGKPVRDLQICPRYIKIRKNTNGCSGYQLTNGDGYILTATNGETGKPQFAPKPMRIVKFTDKEILLKGYTVSAQTPFGWQEIDLSDYGFSIIREKGSVKKCVLHLYDRNVDLEYLRHETKTNGSTKQFTDTTETEKFVIEALAQLAAGRDGDETYHPLYKAWRSYRNNPEQLKHILDFGRYGMGLMIFLSYETISDIDDKQQLASIAYLFISKALKQNSGNVNLYKNRLILMITNHEVFEYTVSSVVNRDNDLFMMNLMPFKARDAMFKMEFADLSSNKALLNIDILRDRYQDLQSKIQSNFFGKDESSLSVISQGQSLHEQVIDFLEEKVLKNEDVEF